MRFIYSLLMSLILSVSAHADELKGRFDCKVKSVILTQMEDGQPVSYSGWKGGLSKGDELFINYVYSNLINHLRIEMYSPSAKIKFYFSEYFEVSKIKDMFPDSFTLKSGIVSPNSLFADGGLAGELNLERYYRDDWHGFLTDTGQDYVHLVAVDCKNSFAGFEQMFRDLRSKGF